MMQTQSSMISLQNKLSHQTQYPFNMNSVGANMKMNMMATQGIAGSISKQALGLNTLGDEDTGFRLQASTTGYSPPTVY